MTRFSFPAKPALSLPLLTIVMLRMGKTQPVYQDKLLFVSKTSLAQSRGTDIFVTGLQGGVPVNLTKNSQQEFDPAWSPDGKKIAFSIMPVPEPGKPPASDIYVMNADGTEPKTLTPHEKMLVFAPNWSPDGRHVAYSSWETLAGKGPMPHIYAIDADGKNRKPLGEGMLPVWSPDGGQILFTKVVTGIPPNLCIMKADGTNRKVLAANAALGVWSPDGKRIAYCRQSDGDQLDLFVMDAAGTNKAQLTKTAELEVPGQWSSDGRRLFFNRLTIPPKPNTGGSAICVMDADGHNEKSLTANKTFDFAGNGLSFLLYPVFVRSYYRAASHTLPVKP